MHSSTVASKLTTINHDIFNSNFLLIYRHLMCISCWFWQNFQKLLLSLFQGELSLEANFYLRDNPDGTVSFESVAFPNIFLELQDGTTLLKDFSIFIVVSNTTWPIASQSKSLCFRLYRLDQLSIYIQNACTLLYVISTNCDWLST